MRAQGIIPPKEPSRSPSPEIPTEAEQRERARKQATVTDLDEELETADDDEERILQRLRQQRMQELAATSRKARFGRVYPISRPDYTREVTEASKDDSGSSTTNELRKGTGVVCFLYNPSMDTCKLLGGYLDTLAAKYPSTKFVSIIGNQCIPNYPDHNLPTMLIYRNGELRRQIIGLRPEIGLDGMKSTLSDIEMLLTAVGAIDPLPQNQTASRTQQEDSGDDDEDGSRRRAREHQQIDDDDDDLDWD